MEKNLEILLKKMNLETSYYEEFLDGKIIKIIGNSMKNRYCFLIAIKSNLTLNCYQTFIEKLSLAFPELEEVTVDFQTANQNLEMFPYYYRYFICNYSKESPLLEMFVNSEQHIQNHILTIIIGNRAEKIKLESIIPKLEKDLNKVGYPYKIECQIDWNQETAIQEEIMQELEAPIPEVLLHQESTEIKEETKKRFIPKDYKRPPLIVESDNEKVVIGKTIEEVATRLDTVVTPKSSVTIECTIFGKDVRETKTGLKIISLKLTDYTDSIYGTIFVNDQEEFELIDKKLKVGKWYKMKAVVKEADKYNPDVSLNIRDINLLDKVIEEIKDDAEHKRVELHAHTMMSQMDGVTKLDLGKHTCELVEQAIRMGYKGVAITDHNGCQAFPISFGIIKSHNKNVRKEIKAKVEELEKQLAEEQEETIKIELRTQLEKAQEQEKNPPIFKGLYGTELTLVDDTVNIVVRPDERDLIHSEYVVFDTETTGFNAGGGDQMIEIGAVKMKDGEIIDRFDELIDPKKHIPDKITELTCITDEMVKGKDNEEDVTKRFLEWAGNDLMVAHNAKFDISFIEMAMKKYNLGNFQNTVIDTLELSRTLDQGHARHSLSALVKRYNVPWEEDAHHRADYDAEGTAYVFAKMLKKLESQKFEKVSDLDKLVPVEDRYKFGRTYHFNAIAQNQVGLKNLFEIISLANTTYLYKTPRIPRSVLSQHREGLLISSGCYESEVFHQARSKDGEELTNIINFYDIVEVQPPEVYDHLLQLGDFKSKQELENHIQKIIQATKETGKIIVATGDVHHFKREDKIYREIIINQKVPGGGRHPLAKNDIKKIPSQHFRTTREMLEDFAFLKTDLAYEIIVTNPNKVLDMVEEIEVIPDTGGTPFSPRIKSDDELSYLDCPRVVTDLVYEKAENWYGNPLPYAIEQRIATELYGDIVLNTIREKWKGTEEENDAMIYQKLHDTIVAGIDSVKKLVLEHIKEMNSEIADLDAEKKLKKSLGGIIGAGFDPIYLIAQRLVKHSNDEGFLVGSRGSVGSSFVATLMGITEVNPLAAHYRCSECKVSIFEDEAGNPLGSTYSSGFDLPDLLCPNCHIPLVKDGQDMPFATFLGFNADKVPDIDLNFSDLNQASTHAYTKVLFGSDNVYRAGTIGTVADKTAFGYVKGYCEDKNIIMRTAEVERLAMGCTGVKRTTGQHPGGIVVIPDYMNCFDFTPYQFPAEDPESAWRTTHFDYHSIEECVLKLDILGHSDPTQLRQIQEQSGTDIMKVPMDDKETMSIFTSTRALGVTKEQIMCNTGTLGIPEFGTPFTIKLVEDTKPTTFAELVKISGLSHGTDVWLGNAQELIQNNIVPFKETIGCRDDIMVYLMYRGLAPIKSFKIMEFVRKGKASKDPETWKEHAATMKEAGIPDWFIESCRKIKYMFPKAHAAAYVTSAFRIAWYKVHMPVYFYASWFTSKATDVDMDAMIGGYDAIKNKIIEIQNKGYEASNKELGQLESLKVALEASARGIHFVNLDLYESDSSVWKIKSETEIYPPFSAIEGLGEAVAQNIVEERQKREFLSVEDFWKRGKVSASLTEKMRMMGLFEGMDESSQLSLF